MARFLNAELENLYDRLLIATETLCGSIDGESFKHVHNALLNYTGLTRSTSPLTIGDYIKGIAVCARFINGKDNYLGDESTLSEIVSYLENPVARICPTPTLSCNVMEDGSRYIEIWINTSEYEDFKTNQGDFNINFYLYRDDVGDYLFVKRIPMNYYDWDAYWKDINWSQITTNYNRPMCAKLTRDDWEDSEYSNLIYY